MGTAASSPKHLGNEEVSLVSRGDDHRDKMDLKRSYRLSVSANRVSSPFSPKKIKKKKVKMGDFETLAVVGRGVSGEVRLVRRRPNNRIWKKQKKVGKEVYALKRMKKRTLEELTASLTGNTTTTYSSFSDHIRAERDVLVNAATYEDHQHHQSYPWLTSLHYSFQDDAHLYLVMEFLPGGDFMSLLMRQGTLSEKVTRFYVAQAAYAISSVHAMGYIHRDIKPDNFLLDSKGHLKLADLGLCKKVGDEQTDEWPEVVLEKMRQRKLRNEATNDQRPLPSLYQGCSRYSLTSSNHEASDRSLTHSDKNRRRRAMSTVGTPDYMAPEVIQTSSSGYTCAVDWWSLGVIMYECLVGYTPFAAEDRRTTMNNILQWQNTLWLPIHAQQTLSENAIDFMACLLDGPDTRIGSSTQITGFWHVVQHPWFSSLKQHFDWNAAVGPSREAPLLPPGSPHLDEWVDVIRTSSQDTDLFHKTLKSLTQNFEDGFEEVGVEVEVELEVEEVEDGYNDDETSVQPPTQDLVHQFYDNYSYRRYQSSSVLSTDSSERSFLPNHNASDDLLPVLKDEDDCDDMVFITNDTHSL